MRWKVARIVVSELAHEWSRGATIELSMARRSPTRRNQTLTILLIDAQPCTRESNVHRTIVSSGALDGASRGWSRWRHHGVARRRVRDSGAASPLHNSSRRRRVDEAVAPLRTVDHDDAMSGKDYGSKAGSGTQGRRTTGRTAPRIEAPSDERAPHLHLSAPLSVMSSPLQAVSPRSLRLMCSVVSDCVSSHWIRSTSRKVRRHTAPRRQPARAAARSSASQSG
jgi:hypothetical protein